MNRVILLLLISISLQTYGQGLIIDDIQEGEFESLSIKRADKIPSYASLKKHTPYTLTQEFSTCVAYSVATSLTIIDALAAGETDKDIITASMYSPHWIYFTNKDETDISCSKGLALATTLLNLSEFGVAKLANVEYPDYHPFTEYALCNSYPPDPDYDILQASLHKLEEAYVLKNIQEIKIALAADMPVVFGMEVPGSFLKATQTDLWTPTKGEDSEYGHALVIVGYDDLKYGGAVEVLNSWGPNWGNEGYIWIKYDDLLSYTTSQVFALNGSKKVDSFGGPLSSKFNRNNLDSTTVGSKKIIAFDSISINSFNNIFKKSK